jgi:hypothetical protein
LGTGGQKDEDNYFFHFSISDPDSGGPYTFFTCSNPANHTSGGTIFRNIAFQWSSAGDPGDTCLDFNLWNNIAQECTFTDCPVAIKFLHLQQSAKQCSINYGNNADNPVQNNTTAIVMAGIQCEVSGPSEMNGGLLSANSTSAFCSIGGGQSNCNHNTFRNLHIFGWDYGLDYSDINGTGIGSGTQNNVIDGCHMEITKTCVYMAPAASSAEFILNETIVNCNLQKSQDSADGSPIVWIDSSEGTASNVGPITLVNNLIFSNVTGGAGQIPAGGHMGAAQDNQYGVEIGTCGYVSIIGGQISQMGTQTGDDGSANICISGYATRVSIDGVNLSPTYAGTNAGRANGIDGSGASQYGLLISGSPTSVLVTSCFAIGVVSISGSPEYVVIDSCSGLTEMSVTGSPYTVLVTNCAGYNDQNTSINTLAHISDGTPYAAHNQGSNFGRNYYGPSLVMFTAANSIGGTFQVNGGTAQTLLPLQFVTVFLNSPYDTIQFNTHAPSAFAWTGK